MTKKSFKFFILFAIIVLIALIIYYFVFYLNRNNSEYTHLRKYQSNEYIPTYVSSEDLVKIYLNDYMYNVRYDQDEAYELLDSKYRNAKFSSLSDFKTYINKFANSNPKLKKYSKQMKNGYTFYKLYLENKEIIIFKTKGVMQYKVYLDVDTVEIG